MKKKPVSRRRVACKAAGVASVSAAVKAHGLTNKQRSFVDAYLAEKNATKAAIEAGYSERSAVKIGSQLLDKTRVKAAIEAGLDAAARKHGITLDRWLRELDAVAFIDPRDIFEDDGSIKQIKDMPEHARRALAEVTVSEIFDGDQGPQKTAVGLIKRLKLHSKLEALDKIGVHFGWLKKGQIELADKDGAPVLGKVIVEHVQVKP